MSPSPLLVAEATSSLSEPVAAVLLVWIAIAVVLRMSVLVERVRLDWAVAALVSSFWFTAFLRDHAVQSILTRWVPLAEVRLATHASALAGAAAIAWIGLLWRARRRVPGAVVALIWTGVAVFTGALAWISAPARATNIAVEELHGWRPGLYMTVYGMPTVLAEIPVLIIALSLVWHWHQSLARAGFGIILSLCIAVSQIDAWTRITAGWLISAGTRDELTTHRAGSNDLLFLLPVAMLMLLAVPSIFISVAIRLHLDSASRNVRVLRPMWEDLMSLRPEMRLNLVSRNTSQVSEHRMRIEIEDTMISTAPHLSGLGPHPSPAEVCQVLRAALAESESGRGDPGAAAPAWVADEAFVLDIAREWSRTRATVEDDPNAHARKALL